jgi:hypothetical protein
MRAMVAEGRLAVVEDALTQGLVVLIAYKGDLGNCGGEKVLVSCKDAGNVEEVEGGGEVAGEMDPAVGRRDAREPMGLKESCKDGNERLDRGGRDA